MRYIRELGMECIHDGTEVIVDVYENGGEIEYDNNLTCSVCSEELIERTIDECSTTTNQKEDR